jgi:hypothetical protein
MEENEKGIPNADGRSENQNPNGIEVEPTEQKKGGFESFVSTAMRKPFKGIREQMVAQSLIKSNMANDHMVKIQSLCEAAYYSKQKEKLDMALVEATAVVCSSFINTMEHHSKQRSDLIPVTWTFERTEENWKKYVEPWQRIELGYYALDTDYRRHHHPWVQSAYPRSSHDEEQEWLDYKEDLRKEVAAKIRKMEPHRSFYEKTSALALESFYALRGEFEQWAMMQLRPIGAVVAEEVTPETYKDVLTALMQKGQREGEQQESESALG